MDEKDIESLALKIQLDIHSMFLPGYYFDAEDVENIIVEWLEEKRGDIDG